LVHTTSYNSSRCNELQLCLGVNPGLAGYWTHFRNRTAHHRIRRPNVPTRPALQQGQHEQQPPATWPKPPATWPVYLPRLSPARCLTMLMMDFSHQLCVRFGWKEKFSTSYGYASPDGWLAGDLPPGTVVCRNLYRGGRGGLHALVQYPLLQWQLIGTRARCLSCSTLMAPHAALVTAFDCVVCVRHMHAYEDIACMELAGYCCCCPQRLLQCAGVAS
jgi:hypothetical protein